VSLQELFVRKFEAGNERDWMTGLFASHPPSQERVDANRRTMAELGGPGGARNAQRFASVLAPLKRAAPAYAKYDQAIASANKKDFAGAKIFASEAVRLEPRESRFYGLLADLELIEDDPATALGYSEKARSRDPGYFKSYLQSGVANYELGNPKAAEPQLSRSMELMPTAPGAYYLGRVNEDLGNAAQAQRFYRMVAGSNSPIGRDAAGRVNQMVSGGGGGGGVGGAASPVAGHDYLTIKPKLDRQGQLLLQVGNRSSKPLTDVSILVGLVDRSGRVVVGPTRVGTGRDVIPPRRAVTLATSLGPFRSADALRSVVYRVESVHAAR
jgi:hypothetical protein